MKTEDLTSIFRKYYEAPKTIDIHLQKILLLITASKLIKNNIKLINTNPKFYPFLETLEESAPLSFLPSSVLLFLSNIIVPGNELKLAAIGQAIIQAFRPRKISSPLQIGLAIQMHHHYRSRHVINTLNRLGFCSNYNEVLKFERNAAVTKDKFTQIDVQRKFLSNEDINR